MRLRAVIKKALLGGKMFAKRKMLGKRARILPVKIVKLENLTLSKPRTEEEIRRAYSEGRIAEMTPEQAGL
ncbi:hypothetical protein [Herbaspirillum autotrophicum]|uniref:hypothetical protein n=1 Tax=Herbaspirillum autotrophicum TaxID=180195 RepID=UPI00067B8929|nr:hypothetical protein [Herbaspirillum autotrophicum]